MLRILLGFDLSWNGAKEEADIGPAAAAAADLRDVVG